MTDSDVQKDLIGLKAKRMGQYLVARTIGKGLFKVKLLYDPDSNKKYAAKVCKQNFRKPCLLNEVSHLKDLSMLSHPHIIKFVEFIEVEEPSSEKNYQPANKLQGKRNYQHKASMIMELASNGSIFDMLFNNGPFEEKLARTYFRQLVDVTVTLHHEGYVHKDIKPENLLLDENFQLKVGDFGLCERFDPKTGDQMNKKVGTEVYAPPELYTDQPYAGTKIDIFGLGVTLFLLVIGNPPFFKATASDPYYKYIFQGHPEKFWQSYETKLKMREGFSESLKTLINDLLAPQPNLRPNAEAVLDYAWLKEEVCSDIELIEKMKTKKKSLKM